MSLPVLDFWFDFASTYSYPAAMRVRPAAEAAGVEVRFRPFLLGPIFKAQGWDTSPFSIYPVKGDYMWRDVGRLCRDLDLPFEKPDPFPQNSLLAARVALAGEDEPWFEAFCLAVFRAEFGDRRQISDPAVMADLLARVGAAPEPVLAAAQSQPVKDRLRANTEEAQRAGIFGAPSFIPVDGELFWGNDRLEAALAWTVHGATGQATPSDRQGRHGS
jgi:2-hydroxychromene-2-carboxylate isomerase